MRSGIEHATTLEMDRLMLERLEGGESPALLAHLQSCPRCASVYRERLQAGRRFRRVVFPRTLPMVEGRLRRARLREAPFIRRLWPVAGLGLTVLTLLWLGSRTGGPAPSDRARAAGGILPDLGIKGAGAILRMYARQGETVVPVEDGGTLAPGDRIRFVIQSSGESFALLISGDASGKHTVYFPHRGESSSPIPIGAPFTVPGSIALDGALGPERVWVLLSRRPLRAAEVAAVVEPILARGPSAIRAATSLAVADTVQSSILFEKKVVLP